MSRALKSDADLELVQRLRRPLWRPYRHPPLPRRPLPRARTPPPRRVLPPAPVPAVPAPPTIRPPIAPPRILEHRDRKPLGLRQRPRRAATSLPRALAPPGGRRRHARAALLGPVHDESRGEHDRREPANRGARRAQL